MGYSGGMNARFTLALPLLLTAFACEAPVDEEPVVDCTKDVVIDTADAASFLGSIACTWPLIADDRSRTGSADLTLTHGLVYDVVIDSDAVTIPGDAGDIAFAADSATFEDGATEVNVSITQGTQTLLVQWVKADNTLLVVLSDTGSDGNYSLAQSEPPSPLLATGAYSDLTPLATTYPGTIDFAASFDIDTQPVEPKLTECGVLVMTIKTSGAVDVDVDGTTVSYPYRPRGTTIVQFDSNGTEKTQMAWNEPDGRRLSLEAVRPTGTDGAFTLELVSVQVAEGEGIIAEYTSRPAESPCN